MRYCSGNVHVCETTNNDVITLLTDKRGAQLLLHARKLVLMCQCVEGGRLLRTAVHALLLQTYLLVCPKRNALTESRGNSFACILTRIKTSVSIPFARVIARDSVIGLPPRATDVSTTGCCSSSLASNLCVLNKSRSPLRCRLLPWGLITLPSS